MPGNEPLVSLYKYISTTVESNLVKYACKARQQKFVYEFLILKYRLLLYHTDW